MDAKPLMLILPHSEFAIAWNTSYGINYVILYSLLIVVVLTICFDTTPHSVLNELPT